MTFFAILVVREEGAIKNRRRAFHGSRSRLGLGRFFSYFVVEVDSKDVNFTAAQLFKSGNRVMPSCYSRRADFTLLNVIIGKR